MQDIIRIHDKEAYMDLLLLADPDRSMLARYLSQGEMFALRVQGRAVSIAVVLSVEEDECELKNLATRPDRQGRGYAGALIQWLCEHYSRRFAGMRVGTADSGIAFYERNGFHIAYRVRNFFVDHYPEPVFDNGVQCVDMIYLRRAL